MVITPDGWLVNDAARRFGVPRETVAAIVEVESGGNPWATRYEPHYRWLFPFRNPQTSASQERWQQRVSWGAMQVMGAVARELGFVGPFLSQLCDPETGLQYGCIYLARLLDKHGTLLEAVSAYNQGAPRRRDDGKFRNQEYVDKVAAAAARIREDSK